MDSNNLDEKLVSHKEKKRLIMQASFCIALLAFLHGSWETKQVLV